MNLSDKFKKALGSSIFWFQAIAYAAIFVLQLVYPKTSFLQLLVAAIIFQVLLVLVIASGFKSDEQVTTKSIPGGGIPNPDGDDDDDDDDDIEGN